MFFEHNSVSINGDTYTTDNYEEIPDKYLGPSTVVDQNPVEEPMEAAGCAPPSVAKDGMIRKGEQMLITSKGLCFSGPEAYVSNMAYIPITFNKEDFKSNEQGIQWLKAMEHQDHNLAREIKKIEISYEVKTAGGLITASPKLIRRMPNLLERMFEANTLISWTV